MAIIDPGLQPVPRLTSYIGTRPLQRYELRDLTTDTGDSPLQIPSDLSVVEDTRPFRA